MSSLKLFGNSTPRCLSTRSDANSATRDLPVFFKAYVWVSSETRFAGGLCAGHAPPAGKACSTECHSREITLSVGVILWKGQQFEPIFEGSISEEVRRFESPVWAGFSMPSGSSASNQPRVSSQLREKCDRVVWLRSGLAATRNADRPSWFARSLPRSESSRLRPNVSCRRGFRPGKCLAGDRDRRATYRTWHPVVDDP